MQDTRPILTAEVLARYAEGIRDLEPVAELMRGFGLTRYEYEDSDKAKFERINKLLRKNLCWENLHTYIPEITLAQDGYAIKRLNAWEFLTRPNINNVRSCHALQIGGGARSGANGAYLSNPFWSCFGFYKVNPRSYARYGSLHPVMSNNDIVQTPNLLATFNTLLGFDMKGNPALYISRIYGSQYEYGEQIDSLLRKLASEFGVMVYSRDSYTNRRSVVMSIPYPNMFAPTSSVIFSRYADIPARRRYSSHTSYESLSGGLVAGAPKGSESILMKPITVQPLRPVTNTRLSQRGFLSGGYGYVYFDDDGVITRNGPNRIPFYGLQNGYSARFCVDTHRIICR